LILNLKTNQIAPALLGLALPLSLLISNYLFAITAIMLIIQSPRRDKFNWLALVILSIPALVPLLSVLLHKEAFNLSQLEVRTPFLVVAILIGFFKIDFKQLSKFKYGFVIGTTLATILLMISSTTTLTYLDSTVLFDLSYASLYIVISLIFLWYTDIEIKRNIKLIITVFLLVAISALGELFFISAALLISVSAIIVKGNPLQSKFAIAFVVLSSVIMLYKGANIQTIISNYHLATEIKPTDKLGQWQCVLEIMKDNELLGVGFSKKDDLLQDCYHTKGMVNEENSGFNSHNEYLDFFLTFGYIGLMLIAIYFLKASFVAYDNKQVAHLLIVILIGLFCLIENVFTRQKGVMITSITYLMIFSARDASAGKKKRTTVDYYS